jgi:ornithine lipid ester-linked acyl 2-hydroxylase
MIRSPKRTPLLDRLAMRLRVWTYAPLWWLERPLLRFSTVTREPFVDTTALVWPAKLEAAWEVIRDELDVVLADGSGTSSVAAVYPDAAQIAAPTDWTSYFFYSYGRWSESNCHRCPQTAALIKDIPELCSAFFAILEPQAIIYDHRGPWRGQLRYHLALRIPDDSDACNLTVGGHTTPWAEGRGILFDDGYVHSARNLTDHRRVILLVTVRRPLRGLGVLMNRAYFGIVTRTPRVRANHGRQAAVDSDN